MKRRHAMPFGAEAARDGSTRFRLWAPALERVELVLGGSAGRPMTAVGNGWFQTIAPGVPPGTAYAFRVNANLAVPDPASRWNPDDVHAPSRVVDPEGFEWPDDDWRGRPWEEAVLYELHVGTFTPQGTFAAATERLDYLADLGVTALEVMPVADFPGRRNWGYDGVLPFAPDATYGTPEDFKRFVAAAHARGLMVLLDVVYNHFGPEGNYLHLYAPQFFNPRHATPWGAAINFDGERARTVRDFFIHNALYWIEEFHCDGLRLDAIHAIADDSEPDIVAEIGQRLRDGPGRERHVHLVLENDRNEAARLAPAAQWNDDVHHALHVIVARETDGYYADYAERPHALVARALAEGFAFQGEHSAHRAARRGEPSGALPATAFVDFLQTHDQVGNRAFGERIGMLAESRALEAAIACLLLAPHVPLLFMGEEFGAATPFQFFCDFGPELAAAVTAGRRSEFARFERFAEPASQARIPDPNDPETFARSKLNWESLAEAPHRRWHALYRRLLERRRTEIVPRLAGMPPGGAFELADDVIRVCWTLGDRSPLALVANLGAAASPPIALAPGRLVYATLPVQAGESAVLAPWSVVVVRGEPRG